MLSKRDLKKLKASLPRGYFSQTHEKTSLSERTVAKFFSGEKYNVEVHEAALAVLAEQKSRENSVIEQQRQIIHE